MTLARIYDLVAPFYDLLINLPFEPCSFDSVVATFSLSHAPDVLPVFSEIHRVLKKNGRVVIVDVGPASRSRLGARIPLYLQA